MTIFTIDNRPLTKIQEKAHHDQIIRDSIKPFIDFIYTNFKGNHITPKELMILYSKQYPDIKISLRMLSFRLTETAKFPLSQPHRINGKIIRTYHIR